MEDLKEAGKIRVVGKTDKNAHSSRSHLIVTLLIMKGDAIFSKLCLVDLAGSENLQNTDSNDIRKNESKKIQNSLFSLKLLLEDLADKKKAANSIQSLHRREGKLNNLLKV